jgi:hypothetical protein
MSEPAKVRSIRPEIDTDLVRCLETWLDDARKGELIGCVLLGNRRGDEVQHGWAGSMPLAMAMLTWEQFKLRQLIEK